MNDKSIFLVKDEDFFHFCDGKVILKNDDSNMEQIGYIKEKSKILLSLESQSRYMMYPHLNIYRRKGVGLIVAMMIMNLTRSLSFILYKK